MIYKTLCAVIFFIYYSTAFAQVLINHSCTDIDLIPIEWIEKAKSDLHIAYGHTSHGSQLITGMDSLISFKSDLYSFNEGGIDGAMDLRDQPFTSAYDLGNPNRTAWEQATRTYLDGHADINVIIWSWCGQVSSASEEDINTYLNLMAALESDYPNINFVYMTGHLDGEGLEGNLHIRNEQIRNYCINNSKILYDFADIESYNPDGIYFGDKIPNDNCDYDSDGNGTRDANWAIEWQNAHPGEWYNCSAAHSQPLNANLKAYAAWWLWARLAGWTGEITAIDSESSIPYSYSLKQNYPNPFNPVTKISFTLENSEQVTIEVFNLLGEKVQTVLNKKMLAGSHTVIFDGVNLSSGFYFYRISAGSFQDIRRMVLLK